MCISQKSVNLENLNGQIKTLKSSVSSSVCLFMNLTRWQPANYVDIKTVATWERVKNIFFTMQWTIYLFKRRWSEESPEILKMSCGHQEVFVIGFLGFSNVTG